MKILELECTKDEMESPCEGLKIKFEKAEERINELENRGIEIIQSGEQRKKMK